MKRFLLTCLLFLMITGVCSANQIGFEVTKAVNAGYIWSAPIVIDMQSQLPFLPKAYFKFEPIWDSPRGDFWNFNHTKMRFVYGSGFTLLGMQTEFETGMDYAWAGNNFGIPEGWTFNNVLRSYFQW